ncbi:kinase-like protein [Xylaria bambusicola]|uniref:kinase-like protein n=1 Tax=Xylaria bambusicola TaxID=326684 RepID=UPI00200838F4|nr:kinase-like protein [Xylaria bambusicola]KAI0525944.1 kinase-like protein [Xylaria bambusicola]
MAIPPQSLPPPPPPPSSKPSPRPVYVPPPRLFPDGRRHVTFDLYSDPQEVVPHEELENYRVGGFHPVNLGDTFQNGRYTIMLTAHMSLNRWVSIKVKSAACSTKNLGDDPEVKVMKHLEQHYTKSGCEPIPAARLLNCFHHTGPNGTHNCLVMELLGPSLSHILQCYQWWGQTFHPDTLLRASCQLLSALDSIHKAGFAHGDLSNSNVAFTCKNLVEDDEDLLYAIGEPVIAEYSHGDPWTPELPKHLVLFTYWPGWWEAPEEDFRLLDLGAVFPVSDSVMSIDQPRDIYSLYYQERPFTSLTSHDAWYIQKLVRRLGPLPEAWQNKWDDIKERSDPIPDNHHFAPEPITETFEPRRNAIIVGQDAEVSDYERDEHTDYDFAALSSLLRVLEGLLQYQPAKRLSPEEVISHIQLNWTDHRRQSIFKYPSLDEAP